MAATIVCGVDRSRHARAAARVASELARRLGLRLQPIHVRSRGDGRVARDASVPVIVVPPRAADRDGEPLATGGIVCAIQDSEDVVVADTASRFRGRPERGGHAGPRGVRRCPGRRPGT